MADKIGFSRVSSESVDEQNMAQIREILFGEQNRQTGNRLDRIESRLNEHEAALRELLDQRIDKALAGLRRELETHGKQQQAALDGLDNALRTMLGKADERITLLDSDLQDTARRLDQSLTEHSQSLDRLHQDNADRSQLAELFEGLARQLRSPSTK
ncbi:MAG: hypothetical protein KJN79_05305 [Gammaproteobacteria bacterium]|nr:hypothetical protein [Gammaproteobacteria bacterium]